MKIGIVSDIHGNAPALARALALMGDVDEIFCLGDSINQYRFSNEVVALLRGREAITIVGNHEEAFYAPGGGRARDQAWIETGHLAWLGAQPPRRTLERCGKRLMLVHSTPWSPGGDYVVPQSRAFARFGETDADIVFYGHTHVPVAAYVNGVHIVNPGAVGELRPGAADLSCAVLDLVSGEVRHVPFALGGEAREI
ncbi:MAG: metallophosphoesterase family protein [Hydrogenophilaceae bacterium]|nr:metallophosphoesterase family protein [Hydrogenophilaceae bacterium]